MFVNLFIKHTFSRANCGPLNAVLGRLSSGILLSTFSDGGFFGRFVRGPKFMKTELIKYLLFQSKISRKKNNKLWLELNKYACSLGALLIIFKNYSFQVLCNHIYTHTYTFVQFSPFKYVIEN